ncbi:hypothetical protein LAZ67_2003157 [Cordylochernes scorpioides]|uniref:Integrase catalytic domain-containing protein n=1 Tax=Cordylochernes scorpioides TaxID=51811 RepID=A0ABY6K784_9ARAC|nr:hypothetical protein LAZ67_2003157 [Cordylochernes scorpioides]
MSKDITQKVKTCPTCQLTKRPLGPTYGELGQPPEAKGPFDLLSLDTIAGFAKYGNARVYLHVVVDHFSRYTWTFPSKSTSITTYQQVLKRVLQDGSPKCLLTDRAPAFTSPKFRSFLLNRSIHPLLTTSNNPQANGLCERLNATLTGKLRLLHLENPKVAWTKLVDPQMSEEDKISHLMKGITEELYQALLPRDVHNTEQFVTECRRIESLHCKRVTPTKYERLPNVASLSDHDDRADLSSMIRQIVREEVQRALGSAREEPKISTIEDMVKEEIGRTLAPISKPRRSSPQKERPREFYNNRYVAQTIRPQQPKQVNGRRDTNEWRTTEEDIHRSHLKISLAIVLDLKTDDIITGNKCRGSIIVKQIDLKLAELLLKMILGKNAQNVQKITDLIKDNPRTTLLELEQDTGISKTTIGRIVTKDLKLKMTPAKFIPRFLTNEQKLCRLATCENMLEMTRTDPEWKDKIITGDETWVFDYDPETKRQWAEWRGQGGGGEKSDHTSLRSPLDPWNI